jgi:hypothetical protein
MVSVLPLPLSIEDVTPDWLSAAIGATVTRTTVEEVMPGSATKVRLRVEYASVTGLPSTMILKTGFNEMMRALAGGLYRNESAFFATVAPILDIPLPMCFYAGTDDASGQSALLLEDLVASGCSFGDIDRPLTPELAGRTIDLLASLHARLWGEPPRSIGAPEGQRMIVDFLVGPDNWKRCLDLGRFDALPADVADRELVSAAIVRALEHRDGPMCVLHGDVHLGNMYFAPDGDPRFLDWQVAGPGHWAADIAYFIVCALDTDTRRECEAELLQRYLGGLTARGVDAPVWEQAWCDYRLHAPYGLLGLLCTPEMQSEAFSRVMGGRFAHAIDDLDSLD